MKTDKERAELNACNQKDGSFRKEIESSGVFLTGMHYYTEYVAQQPNGRWEGFDCLPTLTERGWSYNGDSPESLKAEGDLGLSWEQTLCKHKRYETKMIRERKTFKVSGM